MTIEEAIKRIKSTKNYLRECRDEDLKNEKFPEIKPLIKDTYKENAQSLDIAISALIAQQERENPQPSTNADRIRAMDDKELAEFLMDCNPANCQQCAFSSGWRCDPDREDYSDAEKCTEGRKRWLQQPAEEER